MKDNSPEKIYNKITEAIDITDKKVLEIGCGDGRITHLLHKNSKNITAIDPDEGSIDKARKNYPAINFQTGTGENLDFDNASCDIVVFTLSLHHQNSGKAMDEAKRVLTHCGSIVIVEPVADGELEQVCAVIDNENQAKMNAQIAVLESEMNIIHNERFEADRISDNIEDLYCWIKEYYAQEPNEHQKEEINSILKKLNINPEQKFILKDKMSIQVLVPALCSL